MEPVDYLLDESLSGIERIEGFKYSKWWECYHCGNSKYSRGAVAGSVKCSKCQKVETLYKHTAFEGLRTKPDNLFDLVQVMYDRWDDHYIKKLINQRQSMKVHEKIPKARISSRDISEETGVTQKTANLIMQRLAKFAWTMVGKEAVEEWGDNWSKAFFRQIPKRHRDEYKALAYLLALSVKEVHSNKRVKIMTYPLFLRMLFERRS